MHHVHKYLSITGWIFIVPSAALLCISVALLAASLTATGWRFTLFEALASGLGVLSISVLVCGVGLLKRAKVARLCAIGLLSSAGCFWGLSIVQFMAAAAVDPREFLNQVVLEPAEPSAAILISIAGALWCFHTVYMLHQPGVRREFDA
jgi:amino acid transporter